VTTVNTVQVGAAAFVAALSDLGHNATIVTVNGTDFVVFDYVIEVGSRIGESIRLGLQAQGDWPLTPPPGPHVSPRLGHPDGNVHASPLLPETDWEYWSRPYDDWPSDRSARAYMRFVRALFAKL
jgi:hypothetical protein